MFYNPKFETCDWPANVKLVRPECNLEPTTTSKEPEWTSNVTTSYESELTTIYVRNVTTKRLCEIGEVWNDCIVKCSQTCEYYRYSLLERGLCKGDTDCIPGCAPSERIACPSNKYWKDYDTCVDQNDCTCKSNDGQSVKSGTVVKENECETCQCINNYYTCDNNCINFTHKIEGTRPITLTYDQRTESSTISTTKEHIIIVSSTVTPPEYCDSGRYTPLLQQSSPNQISIYASTSKAIEFQPKNALFDRQKTSTDSVKTWQPEIDDKDQWLAIEFPRPIIIDGIILRGTPIDDKYVTSYRIRFSENGQTFSYVMDANNNLPRIFRGPVDGIEPVTQIFYKPIEAKIIHISPLTWHNGIAIKVELIACLDIKTKEGITTTPEPTMTTDFRVSKYTEKVIEPVCDDTMGLDDGLFSDSQVSASSSFDDILPNLRLSGPGIWRPRLDNLNQYVQLDFLEPRNVTGISTKGYDDSWTTVYKVFYSIDGRRWNPIIDENDMEVEFLGNYDSENVRTNFFERPLRTRFLRIQPTKWHVHIGLKVEVLGCFLPYPQVTTEMPGSTVPHISQCNVCEGISTEINDNCKCDRSLWWNGEACVTKQDCPCVIGDISYAVGSIYESEDCQKCSCTLGGIPFCIPKKCDPCSEPDMQVVVTELCGCVCKPCPYGERYCPTSNVCLNETLWCNGVQDCPDDERNCPNIETSSVEYFESTIKSTTASINTPSTTVSVPPTRCEDPKCPPGFKVVVHDKWNLHYTSNVITNGNTYEEISHAHKTKSIYNNGRTKGKQRPATKQLIRKKSKRQTKSWTRHHTIDYNDYKRDESMICPQFTCVPMKPPFLFNETEPDPCPKEACPPNYSIKYEKMSMYTTKKCRKYTCEPPVPLEAICNVTGRTFNTFDDLEYKYDICNHILAREMYENKWYITLEKECDKYGVECSKNLVIYIDDETIVLYSDLRMDINYYTFTSNQVGYIGEKFKLFKVSRVGDTIYLVCKHYGFWVMWNKDTSVRIGINKRLHRLVDGLCGYFDDYKLNDKQMPDGMQAKSTIEFGNSWIMDGSSQCEPQVCSHKIQSKGWEICNTITDRPLAVCFGAVDIEKFISRCVETACNCLHGNNTYDDCRCRTLTTFVTECQANDRNIDLSIWRSIYECPDNCLPPYVYKDCFRNKCERSCNDLQEPDPCPVMEGVCFSGCFCPEGTVRNGNDCVLTTECRDCTCEGFGNSNFVSFDKNNFTFQGNCTYILSRDIVDQETNSVYKNHTYQVLVSNEICDTGICTKAIIVLYESHVIQIERTPVTKMFEVHIDDVKLNDGLPYKTHWLKFEETHGRRNVKLLIPAIQLEIIVVQSNFAFTIRTASRIFGDALEGLCGNCNGYVDDDMKQPDGSTTNDVEQFGKSWLADGFNSDNCITTGKPICYSNDDDPCYQILDTVFAQCHELVDPYPYLAMCQDTSCIGGEDYCTHLAAYAKKCTKEAGLCIDWRTDSLCPYTCPPYLKYKACGSDCIETCDDINEVNEEKCRSRLGDLEEGCFCPDNYVLSNDTCVNREKCSVCDEYGHVEGDVWFSDKCTTCSCSKKLVNCQTIECSTSDTICDENMTPTLVLGTETECCPKYTCVATTESPLCEDTLQPDCGYGQIKKLYTDTKECKKFVCECLPPEECPTLSTYVDVDIEISKEPGMMSVMNTSGCCPKLEKVCDQQLCPPSPVCPEYYTLNKNILTGACCPDYKCNPPNDICLYNTTTNTGNISESGYVVPKEIGEEWKENNCRTCVCEDNNDSGPEIKCTAIMCPDIKNHPDISDFIMEEVLLNDDCCPSLERVACKEGDQIYDVGETWKPNNSDACVTKECREISGVVQKQILIKECNNSCDYGYEYRESEDRSNYCCGECVPIGCVVNGEIKDIGELWYSNDSCITYSCQSENGSIYINSVIEPCPPVDPLDEQEFVIETYSFSNKCCPDIVKTACRHNSDVYKPGEKWKHSNDSCVTEICVLGAANRLTKRQEIETCSEECPQGWHYQAPKGDKCCGDCKQMYCVYEGTLYEPGATWTLSNNNCTTYSCLEKDDQFMVSMSSVDCPNIMDCPKESLYYDGCCERCNLTTLNQKVGTCGIKNMDLNDTIGILSVEHALVGVCKNVKPIEGFTNCVGTCQSGTHFEDVTWKQISDCNCCQPREYRDFTVELTCEKGQTIEKDVTLPISCSCDKCG